TGYPSTWMTPLLVPNSPRALGAAMCICTINATQSDRSPLGLVAVSPKSPLAVKEPSPSGGLLRAPVAQAPQYTIRPMLQRNVQIRPFSRASA
ncbi:hypothetical protein, partial [Sandaracinobacter sp.]|uniref:hypothetical protein n=1 Tax=Sandaracinobacter sp. TaxID=2487581 RepID=UPI0035AFBE7A